MPRCRVNCAALTRFRVPCNARSAKTTGGGTCVHICAVATPKTRSPGCANSASRSQCFRAPRAARTASNTTPSKCRVCATKERASPHPRHQVQYPTKPLARSVIRVEATSHSYATRSETTSQIRPEPLSGQQLWLQPWVIRRNGSIPGTAYKVIRAKRIAPAAIRLWIATSSGTKRPDARICSARPVSAYSSRPAILIKPMCSRGRAGAQAGRS